MSDLYFILADDLGCLKIGKANNPLKRLKHLSVGSPVSLTLACTIPGLGHLEQYVHNMFHALRVRGEWFKHIGSLRVFVSSVQSSGPPANKKELTKLVRSCRGVVPADEAGEELMLTLFGSDYMERRIRAMVSGREPQSND